MADKRAAPVSGQPEKKRRLDEYEDIDATPEEKHRDALFLVPQALVSEEVAKGNWAAVSAFNRITALTICKSAEHGWLGGSFSCIEIMGALHLELNVDNVILAKGHAAAGQYAALYAQGKMTSKQMLNYKNGAGCPEAHADILMDTGSLGQPFSAAIGMAIARPNESFAVVLGDGEIQEGQVYEALMSLKKFRLRNLVVIVDRNGFQSDNQCDEIMPIHDIIAVAKGFGFHAEVINGHDQAAVAKAYRSARERLTKEDPQPSFIVCDTDKCGGTRVIGPVKHAETGMLTVPWHSKVPDWQKYAEIVQEQLMKADHAGATAAYRKHAEVHFDRNLLSALPNSLRPSSGPGEVGTGKAFGVRLVERLKAEGSKVMVVSMDLTTSCGINGAVGHKRFIEVGVAEQNGTSIAAGLALAGMVPVVCTYSNFLKRSFENMFISLVEGARVIYAGSYSGLCYYTDGKSHQSLSDLSVFTGLPFLTTFDPSTQGEAARLLDWAVDSSPKSVYFRLRRTPAPEVETAFEPHAGKAYDKPLMPFIVPPSSGTTRSDVCFVVIGTEPSSLALRCRSSKVFAHAPIIVVRALGFGTGSNEENLFWKQQFGEFRNFIVIEDDMGALKMHVSSALASVGDTLPPQSSHPKIISVCIRDEVGPSCRTLEQCRNHFGFTVEAVTGLYISQKK